MSVRTDEDIIRSQIAQEAAGSAVERFTNGPEFRRVVDEAVTQTFTKLGINVSSPEAVAALQADLYRLRDFGETIRLIRNRGIGAVVVSIVTLFLGAIGIGLLSILGRAH